MRALNGDLMLAFALPLLLTLHQAAPSGQQLQGAEKMIAAMGGASGGPKDTGADSRTLAAKLKAFGSTCETLAPREAAGQWLALFAETEKMGGSEDAYTSRATPAAAMAVLPPPPAWPAIRELIEAKTSGLTNRHSVKLRLLSQLLTHDVKASEASLITLLGLVKKSPNESGQFDDVLSMYTEMAVGAGDPAMLDRALERTVQAVEAKERVNQDWNELPKLVGEAKASGIFQRLLKADPSVLDRVTEPTSCRIIRKLVLQLAPSLKAPMWEFAQGLDTSDIYPVFAKRWPYEPADGEPSDAERARASSKICYALKLELAGRHAAAVAQANDPDWLPNVYAQWFYARAAQESGVAEAFYRLMAGVAEKHLDKVQWPAMFEASESSGHLAQALALLKRRLSQANPALNDQHDMKGEYVKGLLAADRIDDAVAEIRRQLKAVLKLGPGYGADTQLNENLVSIGRLTGRPNLLAAGMAALIKEGQASSGWHEGRGGGPDSVESFLLAHGRANYVEESIVKGISASLREYANRNGRPMGSFGIGGVPSTPTPYYSDLLLSLADLYWRLNRPADVISLFKNSPGWGATDLTELYPQYEGGQDASSGPLLAAWALTKVGEKSKAVEVIAPLILRGTEFDRYYSAVLEADGSKAILLFDEAIRRNPYVSRPLIWKAEALHLAHRDREAEIAARKAIALDPSDGNAPADQWQKVYGILAEIRTSRGDAVGAAKLRRNVAAAKLRDQGEDLQRAGLNRRAIAAYQSAAKLWPDSALIQIDLGVVLETNGRVDLAAAHYRKAFALLPVQLGHREAKGFELDGLFTHPGAAAIAASEFAARLKRNPRDAATLYLSGRMALARGRDGEAVKRFLAATKADPNYVLAWARVVDTRLSNALSPAVIDSALFALRRLDPDQFVSRPEMRALMDPAVVWKMFHDTRPRPAGLPKSVWRLDAAAKALADAPPDVANPYRRRDADFDEPDYRHPSGSGAVGGMPLIDRVVSWIANPGMEG